VQGDKFQIITHRAPLELAFPSDGCPGISHSAALSLSKSHECGPGHRRKKAFYKAFADGVHTKAGFLSKGIWISVVDVAREN
jgi:hypothetical protein